MTVFRKGRSILRSLAGEKISENGAQFLAIQIGDISEEARGALSLSMSGIRALLDRTPHQHTRIELAQFRISWQGSRRKSGVCNGCKGGGEGL